MTKKVLIIDDDADGVILTGMALSMLGSGVATDSASTGEQAMEYLAAAKELPGLILLDLKMPGMGGIETLRRIRGDQRLKDIPVVIVTCSTLESDEQASREAGATGFINKPIRLQEFSRELEPHVKQLLRA